MRRHVGAVDLLLSDHTKGVGVLVLAGSSGRVDADRARLLTQHGAVALPLQWFGGPGQQPGPWEVPIETFTAALDRLAQEADHLAIVGTSFGAEAALVTAALDGRVGAVVAFAPSSVVWAGAADDGRLTSHWTWRGQPLPFVPYDWPADLDLGNPPSYLPVYEHALASASAQQLEAAAIRMEAIPDVLLVTGGDDQVWPSQWFADQITTRRATAGLATSHMHLAEAGHRAVLPGEPAPTDGMAMARGGTPEADRTLGTLAWPHVLEVLALTSD